MKIAKLKNAPQWLLDANTQNADVEIVDERVLWRGGVWVSGTWHDGTWLDGKWFSGTWRNGEWYSGTWHGGVWHSGTWREGEWQHGLWRNGTWLTGTWQGGTWLSGTWHGGTWSRGDLLDGIWFSGTWHYGIWRSGEWRSGEWRSGTWQGEQVVLPPLSLCGLHWPVYVSDTRMQIGCQLHTHDEWTNFTDTHIDGMHPYALSFWKAHRTALLALCEARSIAVAEKDATEQERSE